LGGVYFEKKYRPCIAFKLNYCDGGKDSEHVGFYGICSNKIINYNIKIKHRRWCTNEECACRKYLDKKISRADLEKTWEEDIGGDYPCYGSAALRDWCFGAATSICEAEENHLCIFTTIEPNMKESARMITAMFIIGKIFEGNDEESGFVNAGEENKYCLEFTPNEARKMKFWEIYHNPNAANTIKWGTGLFRYFTDEDAVKFLKMAVEVKRGTSEEKFAEDFLNHYCKLNKV